MLLFSCVAYYYFRHLAFTETVKNLCLDLRKYKYNISTCSIYIYLWMVHNYMFADLPCI